MTWIRERQRILLGLSVFVLSFAFLWWIAGDLFNLGVDEGIYLEGGRRLAAGQTIYRDFFALTGPLTFWIEGAAAHFFGTNIPLMRLPMLVEAAFLVWAVFWLAAQFESHWFAAGLSLAFLAVESKIHLLVVKHRWDSAAFATAAVLVAFAAQRAGSRKLWLASGALLALGAWATPSVVWVAVPLIVWAGRRNALAACCGAAIVTIPAAGYLASQHALGLMTDAMRWTAANYGQANSVAYGALNFASATESESWSAHVARLIVAAFELLPAILPVLAVGGWSLWFWRHRKSGERGPVLPLMGAVMALTLSAWPRWSSLQLLFVAALPFALSGVLLYRVLNPQTRSVVCAMVLVAALGSCAHKSVAAFDRNVFPTRAGTLTGTADDTSYLEQFEKYVKPGDSLFVFPYLPVLYPLLDGINPTRFLYLQPGMMTASDEQQAIQELDRHPPVWIITAEVPAKIILTIWPGSEQSRIPMNSLHSYLNSHYDAVDRVDGRWGPMTVLKHH